jgi:transcriptional regulator with XRE-family HTH domain
MCTGPSQQKFAGVLGVATRTLEGWEQGRRKPSGAAIGSLSGHDPAGGTAFRDWLAQSAYHIAHSAAWCADRLGHLSLVQPFP